MQDTVPVLVRNKLLLGDIGWPPRNYLLVETECWLPCLPRVGQTWSDVRQRTSFVLFFFPLLFIYFYFYLFLIRFIILSPGQPVVNCCLIRGSLLPTEPRFRFTKGSKGIVLTRCPPGYFIFLFTCWLVHYL